MATVSKLRICRIASGKKVEEVAKIVNISSRKLYQIETNIQSCPYEVGVKLAEIYGVRLEEIFEISRLMPIIIK